MTEYTVNAGVQAPDMDTVGGMVARLSCLYSEKGALLESVDKLDARIAETRKIIDHAIALLHDGLKANS